MTNFWDPTSNQEEETEGVFLIFLSHVTRVKSRVQKLKEGLELYGVEAFVADSDIEPGTEWQGEIMDALDGMDAFVPILTRGFRRSDWTDQEVGIAIAKDVPIIPLRIGMDPYGFMGNYQGLPRNWEDAPKKIIEALMHIPVLVDSYIDAVAGCSDSHTASRLSEVLPGIRILTGDQAVRGRPRCPTISGRNGPSRQPSTSV